MGDSDQIKIRIVDLCKSFSRKRVLDNVDLEIPTGSNWVLIGGAAAGKSVLFKCILGLMRPEEGRIEIDGVNVLDLNADDRAVVNARIGMLFQQNALFDSLTVWENVAFKLLYVQHMERRAAKEVAIEKLRLVGLSPKAAEQFPASLSGGMQKRAGLARAIVGDPEILLLDSPTAGLDPILTNQINALITKVIDDLNATAISITGDMTSARTQYEYLAMIHDGRIVWHGPTADIDRAGNPYLDQLINGRSVGPIAMRLRARLRAT